MFLKLAISSSAKSSAKISAVKTLTYQNNNNPPPNNSILMLQPCYSFILFIKFMQHPSSEGVQYKVFAKYMCT